MKNLTLLKIDEVAKYLRFHKMSIYRYAASKKIPCIKVGGSLRFPKELIDKMFDVKK